MRICKAALFVLLIASCATPAAPTASNTTPAAPATSPTSEAATPSPIVAEPTGATVAATEPGFAPKPKMVSRSGIPYKADDDQLRPKELVDAVRARRGNGKLLNLDRMLFHSPNFTNGWNGMFAAIRNQLAVPAKLRELTIMAIGTLNQAEYEWIQHEKEFLKAGGTEAQLTALKNVGAAMKDAKLFDEVERATLALTDEMTRSIKVSDATMKRIRAQLPDDQVVELIGTIAGYNMVSRFVVATGLEPE